MLLRTDKYLNYIVVSEICSFNEIRHRFSAISGEYNSPEVVALVFLMEKELFLDEDEKEFIIKMPVITALVSENISDFSADFLMMFDLRISHQKYIISAETAKNINRDRYYLLCGRRAVYQLDCYCSDSREILFETELITLLDKEETYITYFDKFFKDKDSFQIKVISECLLSLRNNDINAGFISESESFYKLVKHKSGAT